MQGGTLMLCADGKKRLCFPILCQYISDMEEQWLLTNQVKPACPKCPKQTRRLYGSPNENPKAPPGNGTSAARPTKGYQAVRNGRVAKPPGSSAASRKRVANGVKRGIGGGRQQGGDGGSEGGKGGGG